MKKTFIILTSIFVVTACSKDEISDNTNGENPLSRFESNFQEIFQGESVIFTDKSENNPTSWAWNFGDGESSNEQNPIHTYKDSGVFSVSLVVSNHFGNDIMRKNDYISVSDATHTRVVDYDGNIYPIVTIGTQTWMAENLKVTHYSNGDEIPYVSEDDVWNSLEPSNEDDAYCYYNNNTNGEAEIYGALYTYAAAIGDNWSRDNIEKQGICPDGWHIPNDLEWKVLEKSLGMTSDEVNAESYRGTNQGSQLSFNSDLWYSGDLSLDSDFSTSQFNSIPGGYRYVTGSYQELRRLCTYWTSTELGIGSNYAYVRKINSSYTTVNRSGMYKLGGRSVRCIKD